MNTASDTDLLRKTITREVYVSAQDEHIASRRSGRAKETGWIFDFRRVIFRRELLHAIAHIFWDTFKARGPIQISGLETAAIPIVSAISLCQPEDTDSFESAFFIRKSRKKDGLMRMIEGTPASKEIPVVLVDDILNSGKSFIRQIEVLEELGYTVAAVWSIVRFRDAEFYTYFKERNIAVYSVFSLNDFNDTLGTANLISHEPKRPNTPFKIEWKFAAKDPNHFYVIPKSDPVIDTEKIYFGSDNGHFWALNQHDGSTAWNFKVGYHAKGKSIFSSPALHSNGLVFFGAYDGNVYALDTATGKKKWIFWEADYVGSSPAVAEDLDLVFIGMEFGLLRKRGGIAALDVHTGGKIWEYPMAAYTHSSPRYIPEKKQVVVGGNEGIVYLFDAKNGKLIWEFTTGDANDEELMHGFSRFDIKESFAYDAKNDLIVFGNKDAKLFAIHRESGKQAWCFKAAVFGFYSTPLIYGNTVIASSLDKHLYCIDLITGEEQWRWSAGARIFASPVCINDRIYIGANTGRMTEIDPKTGHELAFITVPERITNKVAYNPETQRFFLPTFANEIYCLTRTHDQ